jgi:hypothetical protein
MRYRDHVDVLRASRSDLAEQVAHFTGVSSVLKWMQASGLTRTRVDIVGQDAFESDFMVRLGSDQEWLAFGLT